jgi:hypothetical protein
LDPLRVLVGNLAGAPPQLPARGLPTKLFSLRTLCLFTTSNVVA